MAISLLCASPVWAAYRVYKLKIEIYDARGRIESVVTDLSNLDPIQYENYHGGYGRMKIRMVDSWYCPGDTSMGRPYCKRPKQNPRAPASFDQPKRVPLQLLPEMQPVIP